MSDLYPVIKIHQSQVGALRPGGSAGSPLDHTERFESNVAYNAADGIRLVYSASQSGIVYVQMTVRPGVQRELGAFYSQSLLGFTKDTGKLAGTGGRLSESLAATKSVLSDFLDIYKGVLSVAGGPLAMSIAGMDMLVTVGNIKQNLSTYREAAFELVVARKYCSSYMPVLYRTVLERLFFAALGDHVEKRMQEMMIESLPNKKIRVAGEIVGVFVGKARGDGKFKENLRLVKELLNEVILKVADHITDNGGNLSEQQVADLADLHVCRILSSKGIPISPSDARAIIRETESNAASIRSMFRKLVKAVDAAGI